jgi:hypothetical protein
LIGVDQSTLVGVIDRLEHKGLISRVPSLTDRRSPSQAGRAPSACAWGQWATSSRFIIRSGSPRRSRL